MMDLRQTYNRIAEDWHRDHVNDDWWLAGTDIFISKLPKNGRVLDVGCGGGIKSHYLKEHGLEVVGVDFSEEFIKIAKREVTGVDFRVLDLRQIDTVQELFDGIFLEAVLLHFPEAEIVPILKKVTRLVQPHGHIYIAVKEQKLGGVVEEVKTESDYGYDYQRYFSYFTLNQVRSWLIALGCIIIFEDRHPYNHTTWIQVIGKLHD